MINQNFLASFSKTLSLSPYKSFVAAFFLFLKPRLAGERAVNTGENGLGSTKKRQPSGKCGLKGLLTFSTSSIFA